MVQEPNSIVLDYFFVFFYLDKHPITVVVLSASTDKVSDRFLTPAFQYFRPISDIFMDAVA